MAKTDWQMGDTVLPDDLNQIGQEINQNRDNLAAHTAATTGVHGATSAATPNTIVQRDANGRFKAAAPSASDDVARKADVDAMLPKAGGEMSGDQIFANGKGIYGKDTNGVAQLIAAINNTNTALFGDTDLETNIRGSNVKINGNTAWHSGNDGSGSGLDADLLDGRQPSTSASANTIVQRDSSGRIKAAAPSASDDVARKAEVDAHANRTDNPHGVTKSQVGLGNVQNYGIASQAQAEAGSASNVYMTPQRTKQYVDTRLQNNVSFRINGGALQYYNGSGWNSLSALKSVQRGAANVTSVSPTDITISPVNVNKSFINVHVFGNLGGGQTRFITVSLVNSTTLRFTQSANASAQGPFEWEVIEFY